MLSECLIDQDDCPRELMILRLAKEYQHPVAERKGFDTRHNSMSAHSAIKLRSSPVISNSIQFAWICSISRTAFYVSSSMHGALSISEA
jgi:hypothetical protein